MISEGSRVGRGVLIGAGIPAAFWRGPWPPVAGLC